MSEKRQTERQSPEIMRKKRKQKRMRRIAAAVVFIALAVMYVTEFFRIPAAMLATTIDSATVLLSGGDGYPVSVPVSNFRRAEAMGASTAFLGARDLVIFSPSAAEMLRIQHGYATPAITSNNTHICIYSRGGTELRVESRTRNLFTKTFEKPILTVTMSNGGYLAVATRSERYMAQVIVYNAGLEELYTWRSANNTPSILSFLGDNKYLAIAYPMVTDGELGTEITILRSGEEVTKIHKENSLALQIEYLGNDRIRVIYNNCTLVYNRSTGEELERYFYGGRPLLYASSAENGATALVFGDAYQSALNHVVVISEHMEELVHIQVGLPVADVLLTRDRVYILSGTQVLKYNMQGELLETIQLDSLGQSLIYSKKVLVITITDILEIK